MLTEAQRKNRAAAEEAAVMTISLAGENFVEVMLAAIRNSALTDAEIEDLGNRIGRIPQERARCS